jgi:hypothetical protein
MKKWYKYTYGCDNDLCDALTEITVREDRKMYPEEDNYFCYCGRVLNWLSVEDATIYPTEKKEEQNMEYATASKIVDMKIEAHKTEEYYKAEIARQQEKIDYLLLQTENGNYWKAENGRIGSQIIDLIDDYYTNGLDEELIINSLCEIIDYSPTKEIEYVANIRVTGTVSVPANEYALGIDLDDILGFEVNPYGDAQVDTVEVYDAEEC